MPSDFEFGVPDILFDNLEADGAPQIDILNYDDFKANKSDEFFISIVKADVHSFIMLGVVVDGQKKILTSVGKYTPLPEGSKKCTHALLLALSSVDGELLDDRKRLANSKINYSAYAITYGQALNFIALIEKIDWEQSIQHIQKTTCQKYIGSFRPIVLTDDHQDAETVMFHHDSAKRQPEDNSKTDAVYEKMQYLSKFNTCRHSAVDLLNYTRQSKTPYNVSKQFFWDLPVKTNLIGGVPNPMLPFYILPLPPTAFPNITMNAPSNKIMAKLFRRMEEIILLQSHSPTTTTKFNKLKLLYNDLAKLSEFINATSENPEQVVTSMLDSISAWRKLETNKDVFQLRRTYFFIDDVFTRKSATEKMFDHLNDLRPKSR